MIPPSRVVSIHPYFRVHPGKLDEVRTILRRFVAAAGEEPRTLYYDFTLSGDVVFCREAYDGAEGLLAHVDHIGPILGDMLQVSEVVRLEIHGSAAEIEKLKVPFAAMNPEWFVYECGVERG